MNRLMNTHSGARHSYEQRLHDIRAFGGQAMSYSALQEGIREFRHPAFDGFVPYQTVWGVDYVLSHPVTPANQYLIATLLFLEHRRRVVLCQVSRNYASMLSCLGLQVSPFGAEHIVPLSDFTVSWKKRRSLKRFCSRLANQQYHVFENAGFARETHSVSREWLAHKQNSRELSFLARPFTDTDEPDVRTFYLIKQNRLLGFCTFDPVYAEGGDGRPVSYVLQHHRSVSDSPNGAGDYLLVSSLQQFRDEGIKEVSLGLSPLHDRADDSFLVPQGVRRLFDWLYGTKFLYHFEDLGRHKERFHGVKRQTYIAAYRKFTVRNLTGILKVNNLI
ncbi:MAG: DUF2156 domain-containing protein [Candidatus Omnitrophica bacterium]|nr:DUF2156 domain-containing protein [Candidatus Omnitrophota bacterium]MCB9720407.1 DUF2156 domain-containing protein [Candidatus Omnitrophota bacterium]